MEIAIPVFPLSQVIIAPLRLKTGTNGSRDRTRRLIPSASSRWPEAASRSLVWCKASGLVRINRESFRVEIARRKQLSLSRIDKSECQISVGQIRIQLKGLARGVFCLLNQCCGRLAPLSFAADEIRISYGTLII